MELIILLILFLPLLLILLRTRKQQREMAALQSSLAVGQEVMTTSGLFGRVVEVRDDSVVLETDGGGRLRWVRPAIARVVQAPADGTTTTGTTGTTGATPQHPTTRPDDRRDADGV